MYRVSFRDREGRTVVIMKPTKQARVLPIFLLSLALAMLSKIHPCSQNLEYNFP
jgi:hypothetical protein